MIGKESLTSDWINRVSRDNRNADKILVEKVIRSLLLAEGLSKQKLSFVFKGGTALMLLMDSAKRLSIDIDIILPETPQNLDDILNKVAEEQGFIKKELNHRDTKLKIPKEHYKFFYTPVHNSGVAEESILLDILFEKVNYKQLNLHPVQSKFLISSSKSVDVSIPSFEDILGIN